MTMGTTGQCIGHCFSRLVSYEATEPLTTKQMVEAMSVKGYWSSPGGKTPHATLYSAILRELQNKGDASRFVKTDRGHFQLRSA